MSTEKKFYALVGNFGFHPRPKGITIFNYNPETAAMELVETVLEGVNVGHISVDAARSIIYITDERSSQRGQMGGGGYVLALSMDPAGRLQLINEQPTLSPKPCYTCLDKTGRFLLVTHHADSGFVTRLIRGQDGFAAQTIFDDAALVVFRINPDGSLGEMCDAMVMPGEGAEGPHATSHLHAVIADPTGELFIVPNKGLDRLHAFHLERENGKLVKLQDTCIETGMAPRYGAFHPWLPIFYANFERRAVIHAYHYNAASGKLDLLEALPLIGNEKGPGEKVEVAPADLVIHPNGRHLYGSMRGSNTIAALDVDAEGGLRLRERVPCGGINPRGLFISPDGRFLLAANTESGTVAAFSIQADGALQARSGGIKGGCPGAVRFMVV